MNKKIYFLLLVFCTINMMAQKPVPVKPRVLISTDIGGTDPDDNQSLAHLLMYSEKFELEGLISTPSFGPGSKKEILRMIDLYEKDLPKLEKHISNYPTPDYLRAITKEGRRGLHPYKGFADPTEGSEWIVECARKKSKQPLWILIWGGMEDLAQALHDAPDICRNIRVYWIGGPNKKWSVNSYAYIASNFPDLWIIENNASYRGLITNTKLHDKFNKGYYDECIRNAGHLGEDFIKYYDGVVKMGDTPSLLYMMDGDPGNPQKESWGGSFEKLSHSPLIKFDRATTEADTVPTYSVIEFHINGPKVNIPKDSACFKLFVDKQYWYGYYLGNGKYVVRYSPKAPATLSYSITSGIAGFAEHNGVFVVGKQWPGASKGKGMKLGRNWFTDKSDVNLYKGAWQGYETTYKWREDVLRDWEKRLIWLK